MTNGVVATSKWGTVEMLPLPARFNSAMRALAAGRRAAIGGSWADVVFAREGELFSRADAEQIEADVLASGYRFEFSATVSLKSEPEKYKRPERVETGTVFSAEVVDGRRQVGTGDNVIRKSAPLTGKVALISDVEQVMAFRIEGVPEGTIAVIDDSGGTLTAPIIESFAGVICLGGTVRSHLGILAREYDVPTLMNCKVEPLADGDLVEIEVTAAPPASDAYATGDTGHARIWKIVEEGER